MSEKPVIIWWKPGMRSSTIDNKVKHSRIFDRPIHLYIHIDVHAGISQSRIFDIIPSRCGYTCDVILIYHGGFDLVLKNRYSPPEGLQIFKRSMVRGNFIKLPTSFKIK